MRTVKDSDVGISIYSIIARMESTTAALLKEDVTEFTLYVSRFRGSAVRPLQLIQHFESLLITFPKFEMKFR